MAEFINTIDLLGDEVVAGMIIDRSITEFNDNVLKTIRYGAFAKCENLKNVSLPNVTKIDREAFQYCSALESVSIPSATNLSEWYIFATAGSNLLSVTLPATPPTISSYTFDTFRNYVFHIPAGSLSAYQSATNWSNLTNKYQFLEDA